VLVCSRILILIQNTLRELVDTLMQPSSALQYRVLRDLTLHSTCYSSVGALQHALVVRMLVLYIVVRSQWDSGPFMSP
jgi:hypothetical protein